MKHVGFDKDRLHPAAGNPREVAFAKAWNKENKYYSITDNLIPHATERDAQVAATIIQWLGSNVGMSFLRDVARKNKKVREYLNA